MIYPPARSRLLRLLKVCAVVASEAHEHAAAALLCELIEAVGDGTADDLAHALKWLREGVRAVDGPPLVPGMLWPGANGDGGLDTGDFHR